MKSLIVIGAHADTEEKKKTLFDLVKFLKENQKDVLIASHLLIDSHILALADYFIYDKNNTLITDRKYFGWVFYADPAITIYSKNCGRHNTCLAVLKLIYNSLCTASCFGYEIIHYIEYDTFLSDLGEINANDLLIKEKTTDCIVYLEDNNCMMGNYFAFNINKLNQEMKIYNETVILSELLKFGICEQLLYHRILPENKLSKAKNLIRNPSFQTQLVAHGFLYWGLVFKYENNFYCFCMNQLRKPRIFNVIVDDSSYNFWLNSYEKKIIKLKNDSRYIKIFGDNLLYCDYDLLNSNHVAEIIDNTSIKALSI